MAIDVRLDHVLLDRRMTLTELSDRVGITLANLSILKTGKARAIRLSTLDAICRELDCQPGDLLIHVPDDGGRRGHQPQHKVSKPTSGSGMDSSSTASPRIVP
jgi:putative transcriptional regulator